ncbi:MAG: hypothetical protein NTX79_08630 [Candidatus Micrarchaeota archaeon]|nr:hypothetical protein [Candidatus Micrarchaeota archaeon]
MNFLKNAFAKNEAKPRILSYVFLNRMHRLNKFLPKSEKFHQKYEYHLDAAMKFMESDKWTAMFPIPWHFCSMKYYENKHLSVNGKIADLSYRVSNEKKLASFVEKQVEVNKLGYWKKELRDMLRMAIEWPVMLISALVFDAVAMTGLHRLAPELFSHSSKFGDVFSSPTMITLTLVSLAIGLASKNFISRAKDALELGRDNAQKLVEDVKRLAA